MNKQRTAYIFFPLLIINTSTFIIYESKTSKAFANFQNIEKNTINDYFFSNKFNLLNSQKIKLSRSVSDILYSDDKFFNTITNKPLNNHDPIKKSNFNKNIAIKETSNYSSSKFKEILSIDETIYSYTKFKIPDFNNSSNNFQHINDILKSKSTQNINLSQQNKKKQIGKPKILDPISKSKRNTIQLKLNSSITTNADISANFPVNSTGFINSANLSFEPKIAEKTFFIADLEGKFVRYTKIAGYNSLNTSIGIKRYIDKKMFAKFSWARNELFGIGRENLFDSEGKKTNNFVENSFMLSIFRVDPVIQLFKKKLNFVSNYDFAVNITKPNIRNRLSHRLRFGLSYNILPRLNTFIGYHMILDDFINEANLNARQFVNTQIKYKLNKNSYVKGAISYQFGSFTNLSGISTNFDGFSLSINFGINIPIH